MKLHKFWGIPILLSWVVITVLVIAPPLAAQNPGQSPGNSNNGNQATFRFPSDNNEPVIVYRQFHQMLADQDPQPLLKVYGNGRVQAHFPAYMKRAGDYEFQLDPAELNGLIQSLSRDGIIDFDSAAVKNQRRQLIAQQRASQGTFFHISDSTETIIEINLDEYRRNPSSPRVTNLKKRFTWKNLEHDTKRFPQFNELKSAAEGEKRIRDLLARPEMEPKQ